MAEVEISYPHAGIAQITLNRPAKLNAMTAEMVEMLHQAISSVGTNRDVRVVVLTAPPSIRAWCGGADLKDFVGMDTAKRKERYAFINDRVPGFFRMERPVIAAINGHAIGIGMILAALCDMRVASSEALFACPEIDYGLVAGGAGLLALLKMPEAKVREMLFTGRKFTALELEPTGFFNYVVPRDEVLPKALEIASVIARKSLPAVRARKLASVSLEGRTWMEAYHDAQALSASLVAGEDGGEGVRAFLEHRAPKFVDG